MEKITEGKKFCYRYFAENDSQGRPVVSLYQRVIIRETEKTFWHVDDLPMMTIEQLTKYRTGGSKERQKVHVQRCGKNALRSKYHLTREEALRAFMYRKQFQLTRLQLTAETIELCLKGLRNQGFVVGAGYQSKVIELPPDSGFLAAQKPGKIAQGFDWGEY